MTARNTHARPAREVSPPQSEPPDEKLQILQLQCIIGSKDREIELLRHRLASQEDFEIVEALDAEVSRLRGELQRLAEENAVLRGPALTRPQGRAPPLNAEPSVHTRQPSSGNVVDSSSAGTSTGSGVPGPSALGNLPEEKRAQPQSSTASGPAMPGPGGETASTGQHASPSAAGGAPAATGGGAAGAAAVVDPNALVEKLRGLVAGLVAEAMSAAREVQQAQQAQPQPQPRQPIKPPLPGALEVTATAPSPAPPAGPTKPAAQADHAPSPRPHSGVHDPAAFAAGGLFMPGVFPAMPGLHITLQPVLPQSSTTGVLRTTPAALSLGPALGHSPGAPPVGYPTVGCGAAGASGATPVTWAAAAPHGSGIGAWSPSLAGDGVAAGGGWVPSGGGSGWEYAPPGPAATASTVLAPPPVFELNVDGSVMYVERAVLESATVQDCVLYDTLIRRYGELPVDSRGRPYLSYDPCVFQVLLSVLKERWLFDGAAVLDAGRDWASVARSCGVSRGYLLQAAEHFGLHDIADGLRASLAGARGGAATTAAGVAASPPPAGPSAPPSAAAKTPVPDQQLENCAPATRAERSTPGAAAAAAVTAAATTPSAPPQLPAQQPPQEPGRRGRPQQPGTSGPGGAPLTAPGAAVPSEVAEQDTLARGRPLAEGMGAADSAPGTLPGEAAAALPSGARGGAGGEPEARVPHTQNAPPDSFTQLPAAAAEAVRAETGQRPLWPHASQSDPGAPAAHPPAAAAVAAAPYRMPNLYALLAQKQREETEAERERDREQDRGRERAAAAPDAGSGGDG